MTNENTKPLVVVTGASGYVGSHVVRELLERNYPVRAIVRNTGDPQKTDHLKKMASEAAGSLEFVNGDLMKPGSFDKPLSDAGFLIHSAAVTRLSAKDPKRQIVDPAVEGTRNVLSSAARSESVRRVVLTSSAAAVASAGKPADYRFTERDWNETAALDRGPYLYAKTVQEREAWKYHEGLTGDERFDLVALNPTVVFGPVMTRAHLRSSPATVRDLVKRSFPACPNLHFSFVDVRDVARAHVEAMEKESAKGRYILSGSAMWFNEMGQVLKRHFPERPIPTGRMPDLVMYGAALFDKRLTWSFLKDNLGKPTFYDSTKAVTELGLQWTDPEQTLADTAKSMIEGGFV